MSFRKSKPVLFVFPALLLCLFPLVVCAQDQEPQQFAVSLDLLANGSSAKGAVSFSPGLGPVLFADWRPLPYLSLGTGFSIAFHSGPGTWTTASWDLGGRVFPLGTQKEGEWYLQGTAGLDLATQALRKTWPGSFHGTAGAGYRAFLDEGDALDLGAQFDYFSPLRNPLTAIGVKAGWTWLIGENPGKP